jgi:hypothetical protein
LAHHVHRTAPMGPRVLINGIWYKKAGRKFDDKDFVELPTRLDPLTFVISKNINRRHWTAEQKREAIKKLVAQNPNMS